MSREHTQHGGADGRDGAEQAFRVKEVIFIETAGQKDTVNGADQIVLVGEGIGAARYEPHGQPIADQDDRGDHGQDGSLADAGEEQRGEHPGQTDARQHTGAAQISEIELKDTIADQSQQYQQETAADDLQVDLRGSPALSQLFGQREREGDTGNEKKEREDGVVLTETVPFDVGHLIGDPLGETALGKQCAQGNDP